MLSAGWRVGRAVMVALFARRWAEAPAAGEPASTRRVPCRTTTAPVNVLAPVRVSVSMPVLLIETSGLMLVAPKRTFWGRPCR